LVLTILPRHIYPARDGLKREDTMKIKTIISQYRRDFRADYECEGCGHIVENAQGYDDAYYHQTVIPKMECPKCGQSAISLKSDYRPLMTKYPEGYQV
jgi:primosomal protein N'